MSVLLVGNMQSILFRQRCRIISGAIQSERVDIFDTGSKKIRLSRTLFGSILLAARFAISRRSHTVVFHGAYSPSLWLLSLLRNVRTFSILQGSELNTDYRGWRAWIVRTILRRSLIVACRNEVQRDEVIRLCGVPPGRCLIVQWGLNSDLFGLARPRNDREIVVISPRATQREYNIPAVFEAVQRLKADGHRIHFIYVRFNARFEVDSEALADERLDEPDQGKLWQAMVGADICVSVPDYDGLSNTVLEAMALGCFPVCSDLPPYDFLNASDELGRLVPIGPSGHIEPHDLYLALLETIGRIGTIRNANPARRGFARDRFGTGRGVAELCEAIRG